MTYSFAEDSNNRDDVVKGDALKDPGCSIQAAQDRREGGDVEPDQKHPADPGYLREGGLRCFI